MSIKRPRVGLFAISCLLVAPLMAQTQIGGGTCSSASLSGPYALTVTARQLGSTGVYTSIFQGNGSVTFDGQSKISFALTADTLVSTGTALTYSGTYSIQANCAGVITITAGDTATFNLVVYNQGNAFLITGTDAAYYYSGSGSTQPTGCQASMLAGVYTFNAAGYTISSTSVGGIADAVGLMQFDGQGHVTANFSTASVGQTPSPSTLTGSYTVSSGCLGTASLTDSSGNSYAMTISISAASAVAITTFDLIFAEGSRFVLSGAGHAVYGQPTASSMNFRFVFPSNVNAEEKLA